MIQKWVGLSLFMAMIAVTGCDNAKSSTTGGDKIKTGSVSPEAQQTTVKEDDHSGWWCDEHGIPEEECSMCSKKAAKAFQAKGDWCVEHKRAKSQCFICDPSLKEKYAGLYVAKYGKNPPAPEGQQPSIKNSK